MENALSNAKHQPEKLVKSDNELVSGNWANQYKKLGFEPLKWNTINERRDYSSRYNSKSKTYDFGEVIASAMMQQIGGYHARKLSLWYEPDTGVLQVKEPYDQFGDHVVVNSDEARTNLLALRKLAVNHFVAVEIPKYEGAKGKKTGDPSIGYLDLRPRAAKPVKGVAREAAAGDYVKYLADDDCTVAI